MTANIRHGEALQSHLTAIRFTNLKRLPPNCVLTYQYIHFYLCYKFKMPINNE